MGLPLDILSQKFRKFVYDRLDRAFHRKSVLSVFERHQDPCGFYGSCVLPKQLKSKN